MKNIKKINEKTNKKNEKTNKPDNNINKTHNKPSEKDNKINEKTNKKTNKKSDKPGNKINETHNKHADKINEIKERNNKKNKVDEKTKKRLDYFFDSIKLNYKFFTLIFFLVIFFSYIQENEPNSNPKLFLKILMGFFSLFLTILLSYKIHYYSHYSQFDCLVSSFFKSNKKSKKTFSSKILNILSVFIKTFEKYVLDFHTKYHHDSDINKKWVLILYEGLQNIFNCGGILVLFFYLLDIKLIIFNQIYYFNYNIIFLWALTYTTYHLINYTFKGPNNTHENHHKDPFKNFGPDFMDILYDTKYDINNLDDINDGVINLIFVTIFLLLIRQFKQYIF